MTKPKGKGKNVKSSIADLEAELAAIEQANKREQAPAGAGVPPKGKAVPPVRGQVGLPSRPHSKVRTADLKKPLSFQKTDEPKQPIPGPVGAAEAGADASAAKLGNFIDAAGTINPSNWPKNHAPGSLVRGTAVYYRGERYYVELAPRDWSNGCYVRISSKPVNPDPAFPTPTQQCYRDEKGTGRGPDVYGFSVHADLLTLAPPAKSHLGKQPTLADANRAERRAKGERDVGDEVAVMLREAKTLDDVYRIGAEFLGYNESDLRAKYGHLNPGQQRMNIGNRMRAHAKKGVK